MTSTPMPGIAQDLVNLLARFEAREVLRRLDDPHEGGALPAAVAGILRARALMGVERFHAAYELLAEVRGMRELASHERIEAQVLTARVLRNASPLVDYALDMALAAAAAATRAGGDSLRFAVDAHVEAALLFARKRCRGLANAQLDSAAKLGVFPGRVHSARGELGIQFDERAEAKAAFVAAVQAGADVRASGGRSEGLTDTPDEVANRLGYLGLARLYTVLGEFDGAGNALAMLGPRPPGDLGAKRVRYRLAASQGKWLDVAAAIESILQTSPDGDSARGFMIERAASFYRAGEIDRARAAWTEIAGTTGEQANDWAAQSAARSLAKIDNGSAKRVRLQAFPSVAQLRNHCGPASVELCMRFFGVTADQVEVARDIKHPDGGTPVHKMRWYMDRAGFVTRRVEADLPRLRAILDAGVPVIIEEDYSTTRHVAVAVGYDDRREILEVQDPMTHEIRETPYEELEKLRSFSNHGALVAVPKDRTDLLTKLDAAGAVECAYMTKTDLAWEAKDKGEPEAGDKLADEAIALHEPYELAWVYRFTRVRDAFVDKRTPENQERLGETVNAILRLWPNDEWPQQFLGRVYMIEERWDDALQAYERARDRDPDDANNWCSIGDCHLELNDRGAAKKAFEEALKRDPAHERANENLANVSFDLGDVSLAALLNDCARELHPGNPFNHHVHGRILGKRGDAKGAAAAYAAALERNPNSMYFTVERSRYLAKAGAVDEALSALKTLAEAHPEDTYSPVQLADLAYEYDRLDTCLEACAMVEQRDPNTPTPKAIGGAARAKKGDIDAGIAVMREALKKRPTYGWVYREMGRVLSRAGRHEEAVQAAGAAAGVAPTAMATFYLGDALARAGYEEDGAAAMKRAAREGDLGERELDRLGEVVRAAEGAGAAHRFFGELAEQSPRDPSVLRAHARLLLETLWYPTTVAPVLSKLSELEPNDPFVLAKAGDDLMDESIAAEPRGEALLRDAIVAAPKAIAPRRLLARQLNSRGRFAEALATLEACTADDETMEDRVHALLGLHKETEARMLIDQWAATFPEDQRGKKRRPLDYKLAKSARDFATALTLAEALSQDEGELADDGELGRWEAERFGCLVALGRGQEAYDFGSAQCSDADDRGRLAYDALVNDDDDLALRLAKEALAEDPDEVHALHIMARTAERAGDIAEATRVWDRMRAISSWHIHVENLGRLALANGDLPRATALLEEAVANGHVCPVSLILRAELHVLLGDKQKAKADAERARACLQLELRSVSEHIDGLLAALDGKKDESKALYERYLKREKLSTSDRSRFAKVREALG